MFDCVTLRVWVKMINSLLFTFLNFFFSNGIDKQQIDTLGLSMCNLVCNELTSNRSYNICFLAGDYTIDSHIAFLVPKGIESRKDEGKKTHTITTFRNHSYHCKTQMHLNHSRSISLEKK